MDKIYPEEHIQAIANAIRRKNGKSVNYLTSEMAGAIDQLVSHPEPTGTQTITENGIVDVKDKAYADVNVQVEFEPEDEGKVVSNGALVAQTSTTKTENGTYDTTENNEVVVNVPQPSGNINITDMQSTDVSAYAIAQVVDADLVAGNIKKDVDILGVVGTYEGSGGGSTLITKTITQNGTYDAEDDNADGYSEVTVNVSGGGSSDVPSGYTRLEYIESSGTQYIDTGIGDANGVQVEARVCYTATGGWNTLCGAQSSAAGGGNNRHGVIMLHSGTTHYVAWYASSYVDTNIDAAVNVLTKHYVDTRKIYYLSVDGDKYNASTTASHVSNNLYLFAMNVAGTANYFASARIDYFVIYDSSGTKVREFYAARRDSDDEVGLWDAVSETFFTNAGSGEFIAGAEI